MIAINTTALLRYLLDNVKSQAKKSEAIMPSDQLHGLVIWP